MPSPSQPVPGRFGRRPTFLLCLALAVPVGLGVALAVDFLMVLVARLLFGAALAGAFLALYVARECEGAPEGLGLRMLQGALGCCRLWDVPGWAGIRGAPGCPVSLAPTVTPRPCQGWSCVTPLTAWG